MSISGLGNIDNGPGRPLAEGEPNALAERREQRQLERQQRRPTPYQRRRLLEGPGLTLQQLSDKISGISKSRDQISLRIHELTHRRTEAFRSRVSELERQQDIVGLQSVQNEINVLNPTVQEIESELILGIEETEQIVGDLSRCIAVPQRCAVGLELLKYVSNIEKLSINAQLQQFNTLTVGLNTLLNRIQLIIRIANARADAEQPPSPN